MQCSSATFFIGRRNKTKQHAYYGMCVFLFLVKCWPKVSMYPAATATGHVGRGYVRRPVAPKRPTASRIHTLQLHAPHRAISIYIRQNHSTKRTGRLIIFPEYSVHNYIRISPHFSQATTSIYGHFLFSTFSQNV
jgi:hypothetical protein